MLGRWRRRRWPVVVDPGYSVEVPGTAVDPHRAERILGHLSSRRVLRRRDVHRPRAASLPLLGRVHESAYLESLQDREALLPIVGTHLGDARHDDFLASQRLQVGGTLLASRLALRSAGVAVHLGGGLHHANASRGQGFCAFNDVAVAIADLRRREPRARVVVIDLDLHDGDGTRALFAADPLVHTYSIHNRHLGETDAVESTSLQLGAEIDDETYLRTLRESLPPIVERLQPDRAFYLAGVDVAHDDALGDWCMTAEGILERDRFVLDLVRAQAEPTPLVLLLAGGYGPHAWRYTAWSLDRLVTGHRSPEPPHTLDLTLQQHRRIGRLLRTTELTAEPGEANWTLSAEDVLPGLAPRSERLLGFYSRHGVELALERYGLLAHIRALGFEGPRVEFDLRSDPGETVRVLAGEELLVELRVRRDAGTVRGAELLSIEWLLLQNPRASFSDERPRLPGQAHPGLGLLREVTSLLLLACERLRLAGLRLAAAHYHIARLAYDRFLFLDPGDLARFRELRRALGGRPLAAATLAVDGGAVLDRCTGNPVAWRPCTLVAPACPALERRLRDADYRRAVDRASADCNFVVRDA